MPKPTAARAAGDTLTPRQIVTVMVGLMLGMFLASLDQTIVSTSIYTIANDLDGLSLQAWATTAYLITSTVSAARPMGRLMKNTQRQPSKPRMLAEPANAPPTTGPSTEEMPNTDIK